MQVSSAVKLPKLDYLVQHVLWLGIAIIVTWLSVLPRIVPVRVGDRGIFVSVAERLLAGDALYSNVWDNKEPLFFYFVAAQRSLGWLAELSAEASLILIVVGAIYLMGDKVTSRWMATAISAVGAPIALMGSSYEAGLTELPGIALVLLSLTAAAYKKPFLVGAYIGVLLFTKLTYVPVAAAGAGCLLLTVHDRLRSIRDGAFGFLIATCAIILVLVVRHEFLPFVEAIKLNISYSQGSLMGQSNGLGALVRHLQLSGGRGTYDKIIFLALINILVLMVMLRTGRQSPDRTAIAMASFSTFLASVAVLAVTGLWYHHALILFVPLVIGMLGSAPLLDSLVVQGRLFPLPIIILASALAGGHPLFPSQYSAYNLNNFMTFTETSPETKLLLSIGDSGSYARLGRSDDLGHAIGLGNWKLVCPRFHQYPFLPAEILNSVLDCASKSPTVIVSEGFKNEIDASPDWANFVARGEDLLRRSYSCSAASSLRICRRLPSS